MLAKSRNDFYISAESYGGHYIPTLAKKLVTKGLHSWLVKPKSHHGLVGES